MPIGSAHRFMSPAPARPVATASSMTKAPDLGEQVAEEERRKWVAAAYTARVARYTLDQIVDPKATTTVYVACEVANRHGSV